MNTQDIIRAWKDKQFRKSLSSKEQALLPTHPSGEIVLSIVLPEEELASVNGGNTALPCPTASPKCSVTIICQ